MLRRCVFVVLPSGGKFLLKPVLRAIQFSFDKPLVRPARLRGLVAHRRRRQETAWHKGVVIHRFGDFDGFNVLV